MSWYGMERSGLQLREASRSNTAWAGQIYTAEEGVRKSVRQCLGGGWMCLRASANFLSTHHRELVRSFHAKRLFLGYSRDCLAWAYCEHVKAQARQPHSNETVIIPRHVHALRCGRPRP